MVKKKLNIRIDKVYTKKGDTGKTRLIDRKNVSKSDIRVDCYGEVDELNSNLGFCIALINETSKLKTKSDLCIKIKKIQNDLFNLGTILALSDMSKIEKFPRINENDILLLEKEIDYYNKNLETLDSFILPSGGLIGAYFHICRTVCRRVERKCVSLSEHSKIDINVLKYLNRLSDLLFVLSRWVNKEMGYSEDLWMP